MSDRDSQQTVERRRREGAVKVGRLQVFTKELESQLECRKRKIQKLLRRTQEPERLLAETTTKSWVQKHQDSFESFNMNLEHFQSENVLKRIEGSLKEAETLRLKGASFTIDDLLDIERQMRRRLRS